MRRYSGTTSQVSEAFGFDGGWQVERRIQSKAEERKFTQLIARLRASKWQKEALADPVKAPELRKRKAQHAAKPEVKARLLAAAKRRRAARTLGVVYRCEECEVTWCRVPWMRKTGPSPRFCTSACMQRHRYQAKRGPR